MFKNLKTFLTHIWHLEIGRTHLQAKTKNP